MKKLLSGILFLGCSALWAEEFTIPENCTAFLAKKDMLFSQNVEITGTNCSQKIEILQKKGLYLLTVHIPGNQFKTGNPGRNNSVSDILGDMVFTAELTQPQYQNFSDMDFLKGKLKIKDTSSPVTFQLRKAGNFVRGTYNGTLKEFGVTPPNAGPWNIMAETHDFVILGFHIHADMLKKGDPLP